MLRTLGDTENSLVSICADPRWYDYFDPVLMASCASYWFAPPTGSGDTMQPAPAPGFQPPPAPQTAEKMTDWTPNDVYEAQGQRGAQFGLDSEYHRAISGSGSDGSGGSAPSGSGNAPNGSSHTLEWVLAGAATVLFLALVLKR
jgi:hypothetical protein